MVYFAIEMNEYISDNDKINQETIEDLAQNYGK